MARWDYHATHINQLLTLATVEEGKAATQLRYIELTVTEHIFTVTKNTVVTVIDCDLQGDG